MPSRSATDAGVLPQETGAEGMEGAHRHAVERPPLAETLNPLPHLAGGLVGEGDGQDTIARHAQRVHQVGDAMSEDARLAGAGAGHDKHRALRGKDGFLLLLVQSGKQLVAGGRVGIQG